MGASAKLNFRPAAAAKLMRTVSVLNGWTTTHPSTPPNPEVAKTIDLGKSLALTAAGGGAVVDEDDELSFAFVVAAEEVANKRGGVDVSLAVVAALRLFGCE